MRRARSYSRRRGRSTHERASRNDTERCMRAMAKNCVSEQVLQCPRAPKPCATQSSLLAKTLQTRARRAHALRPPRRSLPQKSAACRTRSCPGSAASSACACAGPPRAGLSSASCPWLPKPARRALMRTKRKSMRTKDARRRRTAHRRACCAFATHPICPACLRAGRGGESPQNAPLALRSADLCQGFQALALPRECEELAAGTAILHGVLARASWANLQPQVDTRSPISASILLT